MKIFILLSLFLYINLTLSIIFPINMHKYKSTKNIDELNIFKDFISKIKYKILPVKDIFNRNIFHRVLDKDEIYHKNNLYWIML